MMIRSASLLTLLLVVLNTTARAASGPADAVDPAHPWQLHEYRLYGFGLSARPEPAWLAERGVNVAMAMGGGFNFGTTREWTEPYIKRVRQATERFHRLGIKVVAGTVMVGIHFSSEHPLPPEFLAHCVRDEHGKPYPDAVPARQTERELWLCVRDPFWQERFSRRLLEQAAMGFDITHIDQGHAAVCYCDVCRREWARYSQSHLGRAVSVAEAAKSRDPVVVANYTAFRYQGVIDYVRQAHRRLDAVRPGYGIDTTDHIEDRSLYFWTHGREAFDMAAIELNSVPGTAFVPLGEGITGYRLALACLGPNHQVWTVSKHTVPAGKAVRPGVTEEEASTAEHNIAQPAGDHLQRLNPSPDRQRLYLAQGLAEGVMVNPQTLADHHAKNWGTHRIPYDDIIEAYYKFHQAHAAEFRRGRSAARVVVLVSVADAVLHRRDWSSRLYGLCETLLKAQVPYDVRVLDYPGEIDVGRYQVFLVPLGECLSDAAVDFLAAVAGTKKTLLTFCLLGERTENFAPRRAALPAALASLKPLPVKLDELLFPFNEEKQPSGAVELAAQICEAAGQQIRVTHPHASRLATTLWETDSGAILHILNFHIPTFPRLPEYQQLARERVVPAENVSVALRLESAGNVTAVRGLSPDHTPTEIQFQQKGNEVSFTIPRVGVWESIFVDAAR